MKNDIIIQARMGSSRLPGKVMLSLAGKPVLWHDIERCKRCKNVDDIIIATTTKVEDDIIERWCINNHVKYYRGSSNNVLNRYYEAAKQYGSDIVIRITSDCPLIAPEIIDDMVKNFDYKISDFISNCQERVFPRGLDCEIFTFNSLEKANKNANEAFEKEHVTPYIIKNLKTCLYKVNKRYHSDARLTLDELRDYELLNYLYDKFYNNENEVLDTIEVIDYLDKNITVKNINSHIIQKSLT